MQQLSFDPRDPVIEFDGWRLSLQIVTFENLYGIAPPALQSADAGVVARSDRFTWAGGQREATGSATIELRRTDGGFTATVLAEAPSTIRCTKLILRGLPAGDLLGHRWRRQPLPAAGTTVHYPQTTHTPLAFLAQPGGGYVYFQSLDDCVRAKRFAFIPREGLIDVELIFEDAATEMAASSQTPAWRVGRTDDPAAVARAHEQHVARAFGLQPWATRPDVPAWARDLALVVALHGMHWTGRIFNTYDDMREALDYFAARIGGRIEGRRILAFLPGWEGRYYWQYGNYRPEPMLGGTGGFARLASRARELGVRLMPMFGANCANRNILEFDEWGAPAEIRTPSGLTFYGNQPDWDTARAHDTGWQAWLNPGAPSWRQRLIEQVSALVHEYDLPAVFFDTQHVWINDPRHDMYAGLVALRDELKSRFPDLLVAGEGWYDALGAVTPLSQTPSHLPQAWPKLFTSYNRCFLHLATGDPARDGTGVHEAGYSPFALAPDEPHIIPTITVVDGTVRDAPDRVDAVIEQAERYARHLP